MRVALAVLCIGAVVFLLRVLIALVNEWLGLPPRSVKFYWARFIPTQRRGELIVLNPQVQKHEFPSRTGERIAL